MALLAPIESIIGCVRVGMRRIVRPRAFCEEVVALGPLIKQVMDNLPPEKRKGYLLKPQANLTFDSMVETIFAKAANIADATVSRSDRADGPTLDRKLDQILTNRWTGFPVMILLLAGVLWLTIAGANTSIS